MLHRKMKLGKTTITLAIALFVNAVGPMALADEKPSALESALGYTTISGNVESSVLVDDGMLAPSDISTSFSLSPIPEPSSIDLIAVGTVCFVIFSFAKWPAGHAFVTSK